MILFQVAVIGDVQDEYLESQIKNFPQGLPVEAVVTKYFLFFFFEVFQNLSCYHFMSLFSFMLTLCMSRMDIYVLAVPCVQPLTSIQTFKQPRSNIYILSLFHQQPSELSLSNQGRIYTSKIVIFSNHVKICQQPKEFLKKKPEKNCSNFFKIT